MQSLQGTPRLLCVNCRICINRLHRRLVLELDTRVISVICEWISPVIVTDEDYVCDGCWQLAMDAVNAGLTNDSGSSTSRPRGHIEVCILCGISLRNTTRRETIIRENPTALQQAIQTEIACRVAPRQVVASDCVCYPCWRRVNRHVISPQEEIQPPQQPDPEPSEPDREDIEEDEQEEESSTLNLDYRRAANTASHCVFHDCQNRDLHRISDALRATVVHHHKYYMPVYVRVCGEHLQSNNWDMLYDSGNSIASFTKHHVHHVFSFVNNFNNFLDFTSLEKIEQIDEHLFKFWLGLSKDQFLSLINEVPRIRETHRGLLGLGAFLIKMRTGDSDDRLSQLLQVPRRTLERLMHKIRELLVQDFVPQNLGLAHISRQQLTQHNLLIPNAIYNENNENVILICDGTYIYLNKSSNYMFQKDTYSLHKYRNLLKPFLLVATDGYILDCIGPFKATTTDAEIMNSIIRDEDSHLRQYLQENDIFILDRGFRDSISQLEACGYKAYMPESLLEGEHQLTTQQANRSRLVTICRWVVEVVNGYFKRDFKIFRQDYFNKTVPFMMQNFSIAASLLNRFGVRLKNRNDAQNIINVINERMNYHNTLSDIVNDLNMNRRTSSFVSITADRDNLFSFPRLEYSELILFALGTYQIRQARSYYGEHVRFHGGYRIEVSRENIDVSQYRLRGSGANTLIRGRIKSRHISRKQYYVYILIENNVSGREAINEYCCSCLVGRRTIGCCAHVMTVVWYLGWARHQDTIITAPAGFLDSVVVREDLE